MAEAEPRGGAVSAGKIGDKTRLLNDLDRKLVAFSRKWLKHISLGITSSSNFFDVIVQSTSVRCGS
jgi:hypothetical protein